MKTIRNTLFFSGLGFSALFLTMGLIFGSRVYNFSPEQNDWWKAFVLIYSFIIPVGTLSAIKRGIFQAYSRYKTIAIIDGCVSWVFCVPGAFIALTYGKPILFFLCVFGKEVVAYLALSFVSRRGAEHVSPALQRT